MTAYYNILQTIKNQLQVDEFVNTVTQGDIFDVDLTKQTIFPLSHVMINNVTREANILRFNVTVMAMDIVDKSKVETTDIFIGNDNEQDVLNTQLAVIMRMLEIFDRGSNTRVFRMDGEPNIEPFTERFENYLAGWAATFDILVPNDMTICGEFIEPPFQCADGTVIVLNSDGTEVDSGTVASGGTGTFEAPDSSYTVQYLNGIIIEQGTIPSGGSVTVEVPNQIVCQDATWELKDSTGSTLDSGTVASGGSVTITAPDSTFSINGTQVATIPSGGSDSIQVRKANGSDQIGSLQGQYWRIPNSVITLEDTASNTLSTTNVAATDTATIVAPDGTVENSDASYTSSVESGGTLVLPDSQINVNGLDQGDVVSVQTIDVNITDGTDPVTPDAVSLVGNTLTIEVPSGGAAPSGRELMKTGATISYLTDDDGDLQEGRDVDWLTLDYTNPFGNTNRFTDELGGQTYTNNILIDWSTFDNTTVLALAFDNFLLSGFDTLANHITLANSYSLGGFTGWRIPNFNELWNFMKKGNVNMLNYSPINYTGVNIFASSTRATSTTIFSCRPDSPQLSFVANPTTASSRPILVRTFTVTGTTLT